MADLMIQGLGGNIHEPCGTDGLGTCVGLAYQDAPGAPDWYIAHIDCEAIVKSVSDPMYDKVLHWVWQTTAARLQFDPARTLYIVSSGRDFSTRAIIDGIRFWANQQDVAVLGYDGFIIEAGTINRAPVGLENNVDGTDVWTVPAQPA